MIYSDGRYCLESDVLYLSVENERGILKYALSLEGKIVANSDQTISVYQTWGIYMDSLNNLWIFSSDVGHSVWRYDSIHQTYHYSVFEYPVYKKDFPAEVWNNMGKNFKRGIIE